MSDSLNSHEKALEAIATRWFTPLLATLLRAVRNPALAYDLATETLATARTETDDMPEGDEAVAWLLGLASRVLDNAVKRGIVPSVERRRDQEPRRFRLTVEQQREIMQLAEAHVQLPESSCALADALARDAPPPHILLGLRLSTLVEADPLPEHGVEYRQQDEQSSHGA